MRSFLATCSKPAVGFETTVRATVAEEGFHVSGKLLAGPRGPFIYVLESSLCKLGFKFSTCTMIS